MRRIRKQGIQNLKAFFFWEIRYENEEIFHVECLGASWVSLIVRGLYFCSAARCCSSAALQGYDRIDRLILQTPQQCPTVREQKTQ